MSGIAAIWNRTTREPVGSAALGMMISAMSARARDGAGMEIRGEAGLANAWLNTTAEQAPAIAAHRDADVWITADCRLDNRADLFGALGAKDTGQSDAALIICCYLAWDTDCVSRLAGDFAFALWDGKRRRFFGARDHVGVKPFYYAAEGDRLIIASEIRAMTACGVSSVVDDNWIAGFLSGLVDDPVATPISNVKALPPGHTLLATANAVHVGRYWCPAARAASPRGDFAEEFRQLFTVAVENRMRGGNVAAMLSGGLDSSAISCVAAAVETEDRESGLGTYSLVFPREPDMDERRFIDAVVARTGCKPHYIAIEDERPFGGMDQTLDEQDGLYLSPGTSWTRSIYRAARADGLRVLLDGHGGDEVVSHAFTRLNELADQRRWLELWREVRGASRIHGTNSFADYMAVVSRFGPTLPFAYKRRQMMNLGRRLAGRHKARGASWSSILGADLLRRTDFAQRYQLAQRERQKTLTSEQLFHQWQLASPLPGHAFQVLDKTAAAAGVEARYPFWDKDLVEFCLSIPGHEKLRNGWSRLVLRRAMEGVLPPEVQWRTDKINFRNVLVKGMLSNHRDVLQTTLHAEAERIAPYVEVQPLRTAFENMERAPDTVSLDQVLHVWRSTWLSQWLKRFEARRLAA